MKSLKQQVQQIRQRTSRLFFFLAAIPFFSVAVYLITWLGAGIFRYGFSYNLPTILHVYYYLMLVYFLFVLFIVVRWIFLHQFNLPFKKAWRGFLLMWGGLLLFWGQLLLFNWLGSVG